MLHTGGEDEVTDKQVEEVVMYVSLSTTFVEHFAGSRQRYTVGPGGCLCVYTRLPSLRTAHQVGHVLETHKIST